MGCLFSSRRRSRRQTPGRWEPGPRVRLGRVPQSRLVLALDGFRMCRRPVAVVLARRPGRVVPPPLISQRSPMRTRRPSISSMTASTWGCWRGGRRGRRWRPASGPARGGRRLVRSRVACCSAGGGPAATTVGSASQSDGGPSRHRPPLRPPGCDDGSANPTSNRYACRITPLFHPEKLTLAIWGECRKPSTGENLVPSGDRDVGLVFIANATYH